MTSIGERFLNKDNHKALAREIRRKRRGQNVALRRSDGRLDCFSYASVEKAAAVANANNGWVV